MAEGSICARNCGRFESAWPQQQAQQGFVKPVTAGGPRRARAHVGGAHVDIELPLRKLSVHHHVEAEDVAIKSQRFGRILAPDHCLLHDVILGAFWPRLSIILGHVKLACGARHGRRDRTCRDRTRWHRQGGRPDAQRAWQAEAQQASRRHTSCDAAGRSPISPNNDTADTTHTLVFLHVAVGPRPVRGTVSYAPLPLYAPPSALRYTLRPCGCARCACGCAGWSPASSKY